MAEFNPQIKGELAKKIEQLSESAHIEPSIIIENAINFYFQAKVNQKNDFQKSPLSILENCGLIGVLDGEENLSVNYKKYLWNE